MSVLEALCFALVAFLGAAVVFARRPVDQLLVYSGFGLALALLFFVLHAPDVALSEIAVGTLAIPVLALVTLMKTNDAP